MKIITVSQSCRRAKPPMQGQSPSLSDICDMRSVNVEPQLSWDNPLILVSKKLFLENPSILNYWM